MTSWKQENKHQNLVKSSDVYNHNVGHFELLKGSSVWWVSKSSTVALQHILLSTNRVRYLLNKARICKWKISFSVQNNESWQNYGVNLSPLDPPKSVYRWTQCLFSCRVTCSSVWPPQRAFTRRWEVAALQQFVQSVLPGQADTADHQGPGLG